MSAAPKGKHIVVVGAGVIGLQTAISLLEAGYDVTVIAKHIPGDLDIEYTSPWAGAQWRTHAGKNDIEAQEWDMASYNTWLNMLEEEGTDVSHKTGLAKLEAVEYTWTPPTTPPPLPWYAPHVRNFRSLYTPPTNTNPSSTSTPPTPTPTPTHAYTSLTLDPTLYLPHLLDRLTVLNGRLIRATLPSPLPAALRAIPLILAQNPRTNPPSATILCPGLSALTLLPDPRVHPIRGQTITVQGLPQLAQMRAIPYLSPSDATPTYAIPRPASNVTVLGGTRGEVGDWRARPDKGVREGILRRCRGLVPELLVGLEGAAGGTKEGEGGFEVLGEGVGLRPGRTGGPRVELEPVVCNGGGDGGDGPREWVVGYAYGHAGAGYQNSIGTARKMVRLLGVWFEAEEAEKARKAKEEKEKEGKAKL
ncbi:uncharacterized protein K452DRAFT_285474 [Aplosporella prunicola CBS 121167]|uniref:FAD dependent oxidoreductase domain-containing protein n=1 Tax=Aplosporella prunicola CBS 121167 TaxID=1176127 RepID=A0A6A6BLP3_9PEZI|nr:uncharacterized protein K452DRAFT_285474 [Aplosporella prunicola CBS 121167]KAF2144225.1 hypothetical protein K452DRAFT_285474 [Aplosporella prunicola CBS 121167]